MNTTITIKVVKTVEPTIIIQNRIEEAFGEFDRIVKQYTRFDENSELSNLNRMNGKWVQISKEFLYLLDFMLDVALHTKGAFDPTVIDFLEVYGYDKNYDFSKLDNPSLDSLVEKTAINRPSWDEIQIDKKQSRVKLANGQRIDLGGVGKGYAIDCAYEKLSAINEQDGVKNFLIDAGGDVRVGGHNEKGERWRVGLKHKPGGVDADQGSYLRNGFAGFVELSSGEALASSGSWARKVRQFHHLINPKTGKPHNPKYSTVYVKAPKAIGADAWATALFISGDSTILPQGYMQIMI